MKFGLFYLFSDFGDIPRDKLFNEILEEIEYGESWDSTRFGFQSTTLRFMECWGIL